VNKPSLHSALNQLQQQHAFLRLTARSVAIWSPGRVVPRVVRQTIAEHREEVRALIRISRIEVCPSPALHRQEWHYPGPEWTTDSATCAICQRLADIDVAENRSNYEKIPMRTMSVR